ncbi:MAG: beta galactosidase jelly roll domain-containing protein, partial [Bacteroidales bacterium]|nr:beta galactosidase jelly roll domain-containing protein [Bacteroidales bacterium]
MKKLMLLFLGILFFWQGFSNPLLQNVYARQTVTLNGTWNYIVDLFDTGYFDYRQQPLKDGFFLNRKAVNPGDRFEYDFDRSATMTIPGDWNTQDERLFFYEGTVWFKKDFSYTAKPGKQVFLYFGAVNYTCNVWVNGKEAGSHEGGFTPFALDVTALLQEGDNFVIVRVNNQRRAENVPTLHFDWWNYGGITRDVMLVETPEVFIDDYLVQMPKGMTDVVEGYIRLNSPVAGVSVGLQIPELDIDRQFVTDEQGEVHFRIDARPELWSPASPRLYDVTVSGPEETLYERIGFRNITTEGKSILLNGQPVFLKGISIHEEAPFR